MGQRILVSFAGLMLVVASGCVPLSHQSFTPSAKVSAIRRDQTNGNVKLTAIVLGSELARFADELNALVAQAADTFAAQVGTGQARALALNWRAGAANNSMIIVSGGNPTANLLDMMVMMTLGRMAWEEYWAPRYGKPAEPMLQVCRNLETEIWTVAARVLTLQQQDELRELIRRWHAKHPEQLYIGVRLRDFAELASSGGPGASRQKSSIFRLLFLDPFAGLDPATREMQQTRYFAERALFVVQRMPVLIRLQSELVIAQSLAAPDVQQALTNSTRFAQAADQLSQTIQKLPDQLSAEREKLMSDAVAQAPQWQALLAQLEQTLQRGTDMAVSVNAATKSMDAFVGRFGQEQTAPAPSGSAPLGGDTNPVAGAPAPTKHFDVKEYGAAAVQVGNAAQQLNTLVASLEKIAPQLNAVVERTGLQGKELVDYTFHRALWFLAAALIGLVLALLAYRWLCVRRLSKTPPDGSK